MRLEQGGVSGRAWVLREVDESLALAISQRHGLSQLLGMVLAGRGIGLEAVPGFIEPRLRDWLPDPSHLLDLDIAAQRLARAIAQGERIGIIGDYDVDGATSAALLIRYLRHFGIEAPVEIPDRLGEGYGASPEAFDRLAAAGCGLCVTLDNGTTAHAALAHAAAAGQEVIVVDHHAAEAELPPALGVVNPNRLDQESPLGHLAAVGVTFVLLVAVNRELRRLLGPATPLPQIMTWLDLVALGTVCDVVALTGLNRAFVRQGLKLMGRGPLPGLAALASRAGAAQVSHAWQLGFLLGPRLNAANRLGEPLSALHLLTTDSAEEAAALAEHLDRLNQRRQAIEAEIVAAAEAAVRPQLEAGRRVLVASGEDWHPGVIGIVASRLVDLFARPAFVIALTGGTGRGSARSVPGYDLGRTVIEARRAGLIQRGGGHPMAAGLTLEAGQIDGFAAFAEERAGEAAAAGALERQPLQLDGLLDLAGVTGALAADLERVSPFGPGNAEPRFCIRDARLVDLREVGNGHLACTLAGLTTGRLRAIAFRCRERPLGQLLTSCGGSLRLAGRIKADRWNGQLRASFEIEDAAPA